MTESDVHENLWQCSRKNYEGGNVHGKNMTEALV